MKNQPNIGILAFARPTFDVPFAEEKFAAMLSALDSAPLNVIGSRALIFDTSQGVAELTALLAADIDQILILQVTFTDAVMAAKVGAEFKGPLAIWAVPEPRLGGRLRLNAFCGLNLAGHALGLNKRAFSWSYADPTDTNIGEILADLVGGQRMARPDRAQSLPPIAAGDDAPLKDIRIGRIGDHPDGFDTCRFEAHTLAALGGAVVEDIPLQNLFEAAKQIEPARVSATRAQADQLVRGLDAVNQDELDKSLRLKSALDDIKSAKQFDAMAIRCWPETFTEYGGAVCGPVSMLGEARVPCACEADVYGALSSLILQRVADAPVFLVDLVDMDAADNTGVVWHCGQAPISMRDESVEAMATIHTNRKMPLLMEFPLKAGRVTFFRVSQSRGEQSIIIGAGTMLQRPMAFTGTSGVIEFDQHAGQVLDNVMDLALEHHMALAYGDHETALRQVAASFGLPVYSIN